MRADEEAIHLLLSSAPATNQSLEFAWCAAALLLEILRELVPADGAHPKDRRQVLRTQALSIARNRGWPATTLGLGERTADFFCSYVRFHRDICGNSIPHAFDLLLSTESDDDFFSEIAICMITPPDRALEAFVKHWKRLEGTASAGSSIEQRNFRRLEHTRRVLLRDPELKERLEATIQRREL